MTMTTDDLNLTLLGTASAAGLARSLITQRLTKWRYPHLLDDALLIASELITNASQATPNEQLRFRLGRDTPGIFIAVWDASPARPAPRPVTTMTFETLDASLETFDNGGGWGLPLVAALSTTYGLTPGNRGGKWMWATLAA